MLNLNRDVIIGDNVHDGTFTAQGSNVQWCNGDITALVIVCKSNIGEIEMGTLLHTDDNGNISAADIVLGTLPFTGQ